MLSLEKKKTKEKEENIEDLKEKLLLKKLQQQEIQLKLQIDDTLDLLCHQKDELSLVQRQIKALT